MPYFLFLYFLIVGLAKAELTPARVANLIIKNNTKVKLALLDLELAKAEKIASNKDEDWNLGAAGFFEIDEENMNSTLDLIKVKEETLGASLGVTRVFPYGTSLDLSYQSLKITSNSLNAIAPQRHQGTMKLGIEQALLKGRNPAFNIDKKLKSPHKIERYKARLKKTFENELDKTLRIGIDLLEKREELKIKQAGLNYYKHLLKFNEKQWKLKRVAYSDFLGAQAKLKREKALIKQNLAQIINLEYKFLKQIVPATSDINRNKSLIRKINFLNLENTTNGYTLGRAPLLDEHSAQLEEDKIDLKSSKSENLPELNLVFEYSASGINQSFGNSFSQVLGGDFPEFVVGINFTWSFGNNLGKGKVKEMRSKIRRKEVEIKKSIENEKKAWNEAFLKIGEIKELQKYREQRKKNEKRKVELKKRLYRRGMISFIDLEKVLSDYEEFQKELLKGRIEVLRRYQKLSFLSRKPEQFQALGPILK